MMMLQRNIQPRAEIVESVTAECRLRNMLAGCLQRTDILPVLGIQVFAQQRLSNHRQVEQRVVRNQQTAGKIRLDLRPELVKRRLFFHIPRPDAVDGDIRRVELVAGIHEIVQPLRRLVSIHANDADRADRAGIAVRRLYVHSGEGIQLIVQ